MLNLGRTKLQKVIIFFIALFFMGNNIFFIFLYNAKDAHMQEKEATTATSATTPGLPVMEPTLRINAFMDALYDNLKAVFFKTILGTLMNTMAQQTATWIASSRVGAMTRACTWPLRDWICCSMGSAKAAVLPVPV